MRSQGPGGRGHMASHLPGSVGVGGPAVSPGGPLLTACSSACASSALSPSPSASLLAAPPVKGKKKQSEEGESLDPSVSPQPHGEQSRSQSPVHLEVSWGVTPGEPLPYPLPPLCTASQVNLGTPQALRRVYSQPFSRQSQ